MMLFWIVYQIWKLVKAIWHWFFPKKPRSVKPTGTASILSKTPSGIHPVHEQRYFRKINIEKEPNPNEIFPIYKDMFK